MKSSAPQDPAEQEHQFQDLDLLEIPFEGVAAYWLSLKKVLKSKKNAKLLQEEAEYTSEPYIHHLLELSLSSFTEEQIRKFAGIKRETLLKDLHRKLILISIGLLGIAESENPQQVLVRIISKFPISPIVERKIFQNAQNLLATAHRQSAGIDVDHRMHIEKLITHLIYFCMLARRQGMPACEPFLKQVRSRYFKEGMHLILDGFDTDFVKHRLKLQQEEIIYETGRKMELALEMALALRNNLAYADMFKIANSFLL